MNSAAVDNLPSKTGSYCKLSNPKTKRAIAPQSIFFTIFLQIANSVKIIETREINHPKSTGTKFILQANFEARYFF